MASSKGSPVGAGVVAAPGVGVISVGSTCAAATGGSAIAAATGGAETAAATGAGVLGTGTGFCCAATPAFGGGFAAAITAPVRGCAGVAVEVCANAGAWAAAVVSGAATASGATAGDEGTAAVSGVVAANDVVAVAAFQGANPACLLATSPSTPRDAIDTTTDAPITHLAPRFGSAIAVSSV